MNGVFQARPFGLAAQAVLALALFLWPPVSRDLGCLGAALYLAPFWGAILLAEVERARLRRIAFVAYHVEPGAVLGRILRPGIFSWGWHGAKGLALALVLMIGVLGLDPPQRLLLLADLLLVVLTLRVAGWLLGRQFRPEVSEILARQATHWVNTLLLWLALAVSTLFAPQADYSSLTWQDAVGHGAGQAVVGCDALALLARFQGASGALSLWAAHQLFSGIGQPERLLLAWAAFIAWFGVSLVLAWAYSRSLLGVLARPWRLRDGQASGGCRDGG